MLNIGGPQRSELLYDPKIRSVTSIAQATTSLKMRHFKTKIGFLNFEKDSIQVDGCVLASLARSKCDLLIVGVPSDVSLRDVKTKLNRRCDERMFTISTLSIVDYVFCYDERDPMLSLSILNPDFVFYDNLCPKWAVLMPDASKIKIDHPFSGGSTSKFFNIDP